MRQTSAAGSPQAASSQSTITAFSIGPHDVERMEIAVAEAVAIRPRGEAFEQAARACGAEHRVGAADAGGKLSLEVDELGARRGVDAAVERDHAGKNFRHAMAFALGQFAEGRPFGPGHHDLPATVGLTHAAHRRNRQGERLDRGKDRGLAKRRAFLVGRTVALHDKIAPDEDLGFLAGADQQSGRRRAHAW